jgi:hypothetical protein
VQELVVLRAGGGHHLRAEDAGDLHGEVPHSARARGDQDLVPGPDRQLVGQPLFGRQSVDRRRRGVGNGQPGGDGGQLLGRARDVFRVAAGDAGVAVHGCAVVQRGVGAGLTDDDPGELPAGDVRQRAGPAAGAERGVPRADPGGEHTNEYLAGVRLREVCLAHLQHLGPAELAHHDYLHRHSIPVACRRQILCGFSPYGLPGPAAQRVRALSAVPP